MTRVFSHGTKAIIRTIINLNDNVFSNRGSYRIHSPNHTIITVIL